MSSNEPEKPENIVEGIQREQKRCREELLPEYDALGAVGAFGAMMIRADIEEGDKAIASGDVILILQAFARLKECQ